MTNWIPSLLITTLTTSFAYAEVRPYALEVLIFSRPEPVQSINEILLAIEPEAPQSFDLQVALDSGFNNLTPTQAIYSETLHFVSGHNSTGNSIPQALDSSINQKATVKPWFRISSINEDGLSLRGYLRSIDRFIEVDTDLRVTRAGIRQAPDGTTIDEVYLLREFRKMSSKDIHYLDHPAFGVIIAAEPIEPADPQAQPADVASELERHLCPKLSNQVICLSTSSLTL